MTEDPATLWHAMSSPGPVFTPLRGPAEADLVVVGGGIVGLSTALHAANAGLSVALLEAQTIAWGASGRNAGFVVPNFAKVDPDAVTDRLGPRAEPLIALAAGSADLVFDLIARHAIACEAHQSGWIQPAHSQAALAKSADRVRQWAARGRPVRLLDATEVAGLTGVKHWRGGWIDPSGGVLNPVAYARGLARAAAQAGATLYESSPVTALVRDGVGWKATTPAGQITARRVVLATNAYAGTLWPGLAHSYFPLQIFQIATQPLPAQHRQRLLPQGQCVSDSRRNLFTFRFTDDNRLISGGMAILPAGAAVRLPQAIHARLARELDLPDLPSLSHHWSGIASVMPDFLPRICELAPNLIAGFACNGRGIALSTAMGGQLADWATGRPTHALAIPHHDAAPLPLHALSRLAPNLLLPLSILRDRIDLLRDGDVRRPPGER